MFILGKLCSVITPEKDGVSVALYMVVQFNPSNLFVSDLYNKS